MSYIKSIGKSAQAVTALAALFMAPNCLATVINFDDLTGPVALTNQYASQGVMFSGIELTSRFATDVVAVSAPNYATPFYFDASPGELWFVDPSNPNIGAYVTSVSITLNGYNDAGGWFDGAVIDAYDQNNNLIVGQIQNIPPTNGASYGSTVLTFTGDIYALQFNNVPNADRLGIFPFDDLTFGAEADVPEPSTYVLVGGVLIGAGVFRRRYLASSTTVGVR